MREQYELIIIIGNDCIGSMLYVLFDLLIYTLIGLCFKIRSNLSLKTFNFDKQLAVVLP